MKRLMLQMQQIVSAKPTIIQILEAGGSCVLMSHLGRPDGVEDKYSLKHIVSKVSEIIGVEVLFVSDCVGEEAEQAVNNLQPGQVLLLENLRFYKEETKGDLVFAERLSHLGDTYTLTMLSELHTELMLQLQLLPNFLRKENVLVSFLPKESSKY